MEVEEKMMLFRIANAFQLTQFIVSFTEQYEWSKAQPESSLFYSLLPEVRGGRNFYP